MLGVVVGAISSIAIFVLVGKDEKAIKQHKQKKLKQQKQKDQVEKKMTQERQKMLNDPELKERRAKKQQDMQERLFKGLSEDEKKTLKQYVQSKRTEGKSQAEIMKQAGTQATLVMFLFICVLVILAIGIFILLGEDLGDIGNITTKVQQFASMIYPKLKQTAGDTDL